jgi:hypothetical protein
LTYMTTADEEFDDTPDEETRRGPLFHLVIAVILAGLGSGSALLWRSYGGALPASPFASAAKPTAPAADKPVALSDLRALQQQIAGSVQSTERLLAAQQAEIKRLSDQVVVLSGKLDLLQRPLTSAQGAIPAPTPKAVTPAAKPLASVAPRKPAPVQTTGSISTGGAPLPPPVASPRQ